MTKKEAEKEFDLAWSELVADGSIKHVGDDKWIPCDCAQEDEDKQDD